MDDSGLGLSDLGMERFSPIPGVVESAPRAPLASADTARLRRLIDEHLDFIWRSLRRLGIPLTDVDDCTQQVFWVAARRLDAIERGCERPFLFGTALRVASEARRSRSRRREVLGEAEEPYDPGPNPEQVAEQRSARALLDEVLDAMPMDLRAVFMLFELEEMPTGEIATALDLAPGTVASRLRRAREEFRRIATRVQARVAFPGGKR
jgi:RNA polymerase sigma-70 factor, ECF subfamily